MTLSRNIYRLTLCVLLLPAAYVFAADDPPPELRRWPVGVQIEFDPMSLFRTTTAAVSTTNPVADYSYTADSSAAHFSVAPTVQYNFSKRFSLGLEIRFHHAEYQQTTQMLSGRPDPNTNYDGRGVNTFVETTKAQYWEAPLIARYSPFGGKGLVSRAYVAGGLDFRHVGTVQTSNSFSYADSTTDSNTTSTKPNSANQIGFIAGVGMRFVNQTNIKVRPEVRFVRWRGTTFQGPAFRSAVNQLDVGVGFTF